MNWYAIALIEAGVILTLLYLIIVRRVGRPLSEAEVQYKIHLKQEREREGQAREQQELARLRSQEDAIAAMETPIVLVSVVIPGYGSETYNMCVQDGTKKRHNLIVKSWHVDQCPRLQSLFSAAGWSEGDPWIWERGSVLVG